MENAKMKKLKALNEDKALDLKDLDSVAGGTCYEMSDDSKFLNVLLRGRTGQPDRYGATKIWVADTFSSGIANELKAAWESLGITYIPNSSTDGKCTYKLARTGGEISREEAWDYVQARVGKYLQRSDWDF